MDAALAGSRYGPREVSARNLLHYLSFRRFDLRADQNRLAHWGVSSLGRSESHVLSNLDAVLSLLYRLRGVDRPPRGGRPGLDPEHGRRLLAANAVDLFGPTRPGRGVRIMVTMPSEAATDARLVRELVARGMDVARINCAHDSPAEWGRMISNLLEAERSTDRKCRVLMDLPGPKIRTGPMRPGPRVVRVRPKRDAIGRVVAPARVRFVVEDAPRSDVPDTTPTLPVGRGWMARRHRGDRVQLTDTRGARREFRIVGVSGRTVDAESLKTAYVATGTVLRVARGDPRLDRTRVGPLPRTPLSIPLRVRDRLVLTAEAIPGEPALRTPRGRARRPAHISCSLPEVLVFVRPGESVWLDDGKIGTVVRSASARRLVLEVINAPASGAKLGADKGINLPDTALELPALTGADLRDLRYVVRHADLVGYSFVQRAEDVAELRRQLARLGRPRMGIILKIETRRAFEELPRLLLAALEGPSAGVMIARGDLAVEVGYERLAEVQEEILWLSEAAHLPSIWATQVLEGLTKSGVPSRAEVTDAAMGERAECVMLNKGPHLVEAVGALDGILARMQSHQAKKTAMLRHLNVVESFFHGSEAHARRDRPVTPAARPGAALARPSRPRSRPRRPRPRLPPRAMANRAS